MLTNDLHVQAGVAVPGVASQWVAPDGSDPMDRMLVVLVRISNSQRREKCVGGLMAGTVWCRNRPLRSWRTWLYVPSFRMQDNNRASVELTFVPWRQAKATTTIQSRGGGAQQQAAAAGDRAAWGQQLTAVSAWQPQTLNTKASSV